MAVAIAINALALWIANVLWDSVSIHGFWAYFIGAAVLGVANAVLKPLLALLTLPLIILTLGLFYLAINIAMVALAEWIAPNFSIDGFWTYVGTIVVVWAVNWIGHSLADEVSRRPRTRLAAPAEAVEDVADELDPRDPGRDLVERSAECRRGVRLEGRRRSGRAS